VFGPLPSFEATPLPARRGVLVATSPGELELDRAREIARVTGAILHVLRLPPRGGAEDVFAIVGAARKTSASLALVSATRFGRRYLAERVHDAVGTAVLQVKNEARGAYAHVIIAADEASPLAAMTSAARWLAPTAERVEYVHACSTAFESGSFRQSCTNEARDRMGERFERAGLGSSALRVEHGPPAIVLSGAPASALVVVHRRRPSLRPIVLGSVTHSVLADCRADVLLV
jgi:hypothetical protein